MFNKLLSVPKYCIFFLNNQFFYYRYFTNMNKFTWVIHFLKLYIIKQKTMFSFFVYNDYILLNSNLTPTITVATCNLLYSRATSTYSPFFFLNYSADDFFL